MVIKKVKTKEIIPTKNITLTEGFLVGSEIHSKIADLTVLADAFGGYDANDFKSLDNFLSDFIEVSQNVLYFEYKTIKGVKKLVFEVNGLPYCCGTYEFGHLEASLDFPQSAFNSIMEQLLSYKGKTIVINTNGKDDSIMWEKLLKGSKMFTDVKKFVNSGSKNTITMWVSNNN